MKQFFSSPIPGVALALVDLAFNVALQIVPVGVNLGVASQERHQFIAWSMVFMLIFTVWAFIAYELKLRAAREEIAELAEHRPEFAPHYTGIEQFQDTAGHPLPNQFGICLAFLNASRIPVKRFSRHLVVFIAFDADPISVNTSTSANVVYEPISIRTPIDIPRPAGPHYFAVFLSYEDSRNSHPYYQRFYFYWPGTTLIDFPMHFRSATFEQGEAIDTYLRTRRLMPSALHTAWPHLAPAA